MSTSPNRNQGVKISVWVSQKRLALSLGFCLSFGSGFVTGNNHGQIQAQHHGQSQTQVANCNLEQTTKTVPTTPIKP
ncbi:hypothetical protein [Microseira wollei]|uniref:Uncharacterized protein n=1 Tax=Microseira wollei NIES-4236 TaxID=2530354 RepID=A0AAV3XJ39_9CYAN|nr:hypothetical protein [Microseira wollei]GET42668.1 hypothetical protein MiSe_74860 [Microseira wollei NIES-4236]